MLLLSNGTLPADLKLCETSGCASLKLRVDLAAHR
jgi:hypothetical protein